MLQLISKKNRKIENIAAAVKSSAVAGAEQFYRAGYNKAVDFLKVILIELIYILITITTWMTKMDKRMIKLTKKTKTIKLL